MTRQFAFLARAKPSNIDSPSTPVVKHGGEKLSNLRQSAM